MTAMIDDLAAALDAGQYELLAVGLFGGLVAGLFFALLFLRMFMWCFAFFGLRS